MNPKIILIVAGAFAAIWMVSHVTPPPAPPQHEVTVASVSSACDRDALIKTAYLTYSTPPDAPEYALPHGCTNADLYRAYQQIRAFCDRLGWKGPLDGGNMVCYSMKKYGY
jgi:hypothetical protein